MFRLRSEHRDAFRQSSTEGFTNRVLKHVREFLPEETAAFSDHSIRERARRCVDRAKKHGLITEKQVFCFIDATFIAGDDFDTHPDHEWARHVLTGEGVTPDQRAGALLGLAYALQERGYQPGALNPPELG